MNVLLVSVSHTLARNLCPSLNSVSFRTCSVHACCSARSCVVMQLYVDTLAEIESLVATYRTEWDMPQLRLHHTGSRGYHVLLPATVEVSARARWRMQTHCCPAARGACTRGALCDAKCMCC